MPGEFIGNKEVKGQEVAVPAAEVQGQIKIEDLTEFDILSDAVIAQPLGFDSSLDITKRIRRKEFYYRWVNRIGGESRRYQECIAQGFVNATYDDVDVDESMRKDGLIICGDLILMKMDKMKAFGAMKANVLKSEAMVKPKKIISDIQSDAAKATNAPADVLAKKVSFFEQAFK